MNSTETPYRYSRSSAEDREWGQAYRRADGRASDETGEHGTDRPIQTSVCFFIDRPRAVLITSQHFQRARETRSWAASISYDMARPRLVRTITTSCRPPVFASLKSSARTWRSWA